MSSTRQLSQGSDLNDTINPDGELTKLISGGQLTGPASAWLMNNGKNMLDWFKQPRKFTGSTNWRVLINRRSDVRKMLLASGITFGTVILLVASLGFGSLGVGGGELFPRPIEPSKWRVHLHTCGLTPI